MTRLVLIATALTVVGLGAAQAAPRDPHRSGALTSAPVRLQTMAPAVRPPWAQPGECYTDEGYGRFRSCSAGGRG